MSELLPEGWSNKNLSDIASLQYGKSPKTVITDDGAYPIIGTGGITGYATEFLHEGHTTVVGRKGSINRPSFIREKFWAIDTTYYADNYKNTEPKWLFYCLNNIDLTKYNEASGVPSLNRDTLYAIPFRHPPLPEQQKIATILTSVDNVIEKTEAQINKLQDLKKGMMQELLSPQEGSRQAKAFGHTEFKDSPVGRIPKGWEVKALSQVAKVSRGKFSHRPRNDPKFYDGDIPFIQTGDIPKDAPYIKDSSQSLNERGLGVSRLFNKGTLVITIAATIGEIGVLNFDSCFPDSLVGIEVDKDKANPFFILYIMRTRKEELNSSAPQTAQKNINLDTLNPLAIPIPPIEEQELIAESILSVDEKITTIKTKLQRLHESKKALMQDLLTGKVRVKINESEKEAMVG